jgi:hypothetical protein
MIERYFELKVELKWQGPKDLHRQPKDGSVITAGNDPVWPMSTLTGTFRSRPGELIVHDWLPWSPGHTTRKALVGQDILSGPFTGCLMALWHAPLDGSWKVGHIGTTENEHEVNARVKSTFGNYMHEGTTGFNPSEAWSTSEIVAMRHRLHGDINWKEKILGLVTTSRHFYSILMFRPRDEGPNTKWYVGGKKLVQPMNYEQLRSLLNPMPQRPLPLTPPQSRLDRLGRRLIPG